MTFLGWHTIVYCVDYRNNVLYSMYLVRQKFRKEYYEYKKF
jgi:hypothetical protein